MIARSICALAIVLAAFSPIVRAQPRSVSPPPSRTTALIDALPAGLRGAARQVYDAERFIPDAPAAAALDVLFKEPAATDFLLAQILDASQSPAKRRDILERAPRFDHFIRYPATLGVLASLAAHPDPGFAAAAQEDLRLVFDWQRRMGLEEQLAAARRKGDAAQVAQLLEQHETLIVRQGFAPGYEIDLPIFLRKPPPVFTVRPATQNKIRLLIMGDFGASTSAGMQTQIKVAQAIRKLHGLNPFEFGATMGDNFYGYGLDDPGHPRWKSQWEDLYTPLGIQIYASLGNHDWIGSSPAAEVLYTQRSPSWRMPAIYYSYIAGPVQFFVLETNSLREGAQKQIEWLRDAIAASRSPWKVVYGHHPIYTQVEQDGKSVLRESQQLIEHMLPVIENKVDVYFVGHHHSQQHHKSFKGIHQFICGSSGFKIYPVGPGLAPGVLWARAAMGFAALDVTPKSFTATYYDDEARQIYSYTIDK